MKKKLICTFCIVFTMLLTSFCLISCDLSCKHTYTTFGICNTCKKDISITLTSTNENCYSSASTYVRSNFTYYFKFKPNKNNHFEVSSTSADNVYIKEVKLYASTTSNAQPLVKSLHYNSNTFSYLENLTVGNTYYLEISFDKSGATANNFIGNIVIYVNFI